MRVSTDSMDRPAPPNRNMNGSPYHVTYDGSSGPHSWRLSGSG